MKAEENAVSMKGITGRWLRNSILPILLILLLVIVVASVAVQRYYYSTVRSTLISRATVVRTFYSSLTSETQDSYTRFRSVMDDYDEQHLVEMFLLDQNGTPVVTSSGFYSSEDFPSEDYTLAFQDEDGVGIWTGTLPQTNEKVMAVSALLYDQNGRLSGAVRLMVSMSRADLQIMVIIVGMAIIGVALLLFSVSSGTYFVRSIVKPVNEIAAITKRISGGDYSCRINKPYDDEIGDLCDAINYLASELDTSDRMKNDFISSVSHELRTPLTAIKGWGETMLMSPDDTELTEKGIKVVVNETNRLSDMVEDLLDFSRLQSGRLVMHMSKADIIAELQEAELVFRQRAAIEGKELKLILPEEPIPPIIADGARLKQVFINILDNAFKYSEEGGSITVSVSESENHIKVIVSDTGCGISETDLAHIKEKFYRANASRRGAGIGLAVCDEIIHQHNGVLEIESTNGQGTTVTINIPISQPENTAS